MLKINGPTSTDFLAGGFAGANPLLRADAEVVVFAADGTTERARFRLSRCLPLKLKASALNAKDGVVAIEEMQLAYEELAYQCDDAAVSLVVHDEAWAVPATKLAGERVVLLVCIIRHNFLLR